MRINFWTDLFCSCRNKSNNYLYFDTNKTYVRIAIIFPETKHKKGIPGVIHTCKWNSFFGSHAELGKFEKTKVINWKTVRARYLGKSFFHTIHQVYTQTKTKTQISPTYISTLTITTITDRNIKRNLIPRCMKARKTNLSNISI